MNPTGSEHITRLLDLAGSGDSHAADELLPLVYGELRRLAAANLAHEPAGLTLQPTALVHEAYLKLVGGQQIAWRGKQHFFATAARAMRQILIDRARRRQTEKHGGGHARRDIEVGELTIAAPTPQPDEPPVDLLHLNSALERLEASDPRQAEVVLLRYFAGLSIEQTAEALNVSPATVKNDWAYARAWLRREMEQRP